MLTNSSYNSLVLDSERSVECIDFTIMCVSFVYVCVQHNVEIMLQFQTLGNSRSR